MAIPVAALMAAKEGSEVLGGVIGKARERAESMEGREGTQAEKSFVIDRLLDVMDSENTMNLKGPEATAHKEANTQLGKMMNDPKQVAQVAKTVSRGLKGPGM